MRIKELKIVLAFFPVFYQLLSFFLKIPGYNSLNGVGYKDAANWELCAKSLALYGEFPNNINEWCLRRPLNSELLATFYKTLGTFVVMNFILALIYSITLYWLAQHLNQFFVYTTSLVIIFIQLCLWLFFANNMLLSETFSLILGNFAGIFLLKYLKTYKILYLFVFVVDLTLIQLIRPGNILIILSVTFLFIDYFKRYRFDFVYLGLALMLPFIYLTVPKLVARSFDYSVYLTSGNSWSSFYGLVQNNSTWQEAYARIPSHIGNSEIAINEYLKAESIRLFLDHPLTLFKSLSQNFYEMISTNIPFFLPTNFIVPDTFQVLIFLVNSIFLLLLSWKVYENSENFLLKNFLIFVIISSLGFYALAWKSEASRALSPTFLVLSISVALLLRRSNFIKRNLPSDKLYEPQLRRNYVKLFFFTLLPILLIISSMTYNRLPEKNLSNIIAISACGSDAFRFDPTSISASNINEIRIIPVFGWAELVRQLPPGVFIQGLTLSAGRPYAYTVYVSEVDLVDISTRFSTCFRFQELNEKLKVLEQMNFKNAVPSS
jgi:hypothetical protein